MFCTACGAHLPEQLRFCHMCGKQQPPLEQATVSPQRVPYNAVAVPQSRTLAVRRGKRWPLFAAAGAILAVLVVLVICLLPGPESQPNPDQTSTVASAKTETEATTTAVAKKKSSRLLSADPEFAVFLEPTLVMDRVEFLKRFSPTFRERFARFAIANDKINDPDLRKATVHDFVSNQDAVVWTEADANFSQEGHEFFARSSDNWVELAEYCCYDTSTKQLEFSIKKDTYLLENTREWQIAAISISAGISEADAIFTQYRTSHEAEIYQMAKTVRQEEVFCPEDGCLRKAEEYVRRDDLVLVAEGDVEKRLWTKASVMDRKTEQVLFTVPGSEVTSKLNSLKWPPIWPPGVVPSVQYREQQ